MVELQLQDVSRLGWNKLKNNQFVYPGEGLSETEDGGVVIVKKVDR